MKIIWAKGNLIKWQAVRVYELPNSRYLPECGALWIRRQGPLRWS